MQSYQTRKPAVPRPKQVAYGEDGKVVVAGSDHGVVYVFGKKDASTLDRLMHPEGGLVQALTVSRYPQVAA